jgi:hypothetical protein
MHESVAKAGLVAIACGALAVAGLVAGLQVEAFAPCRVLYRIPQAVQDSLACRMHSAIGLASLLFLVVAAGSGVATGVLMFFRRRATK